MRLSQLFSGEVRTDNAVRAQPSPAQIEQWNRQIRALTPGQTIQGEILSRNGGEVQIRLSEDMVLSARIDRSLNIEVGRNMTFEVKNNGSALTLSPLFTNVATDVNVLKALDMAGLPVNRISIDMTEQLMKAGLPVNKNMLQQIYREINAFPQGEVSDVINLHKLQLPVNEANMDQMASYRNLTHQLLEGMDTILSLLPEAVDSMISGGDLYGAVRFVQEILELFRGEEALPGEEGLSPGEQTEGTSPGTFSPQEILPAEEGAEGRTSDAGTLAKTDGTAGPGEGTAGQSAGGVTGAEEGLRGAVAGQALEILEHLRLSGQDMSAFREQILQFAWGETGAGQFFQALASMAETARFSEESMKALGKMFAGKEFQQLMAAALKDNWTIRPEELAVPGKVEELYRRLDRQMRGLTGALEDAGQSNSAAFRAATSMSQNVDFLQQINQMYAYVQLPLKLRQGEAHGELYVYTNKKHLAREDGSVSALLHLDMEHLGPVDVYVAMRNNKVNTQFYLRDDEMIDFLGAHMDILTERLNKRGYDCDFAITVKGAAEQETTEGGLDPLLRREKGIMLSQYAFDVRT